MIVKIEMNPNVLKEDAGLRDVFSQSANKRIPLNDFERIGLRHGFYTYFGYLKDKKFAGRRLLEKLALTVFYCNCRSYYLFKEILK